MLVVVVYIIYNFIFFPKIILLIVFNWQESFINLVMQEVNKMVFLGLYLALGPVHRNCTNIIWVHFYESNVLQGVTSKVLLQLYVECRL